MVTGTSAGIGNRLARTLVLAGARVAAIARRTTELDEEATSTGRLLPMTADLSERTQVVAVAEACLEEFDGRVDILVNNAAYIAAGVKAEDESEDDVHRTVAVNLEAPIVLAAALVYSRRAPSPRVGRLADIVDVLAIMALVPLACAVAGIFQTVQGLFASVGG